MINRIFMILGLILFTLLTYKHCHAFSHSLTWDASESEVDGYHVYQVTTEGCDLLTTTTELTYTHSGLSADGTYCYVVRSYRENGLESDNSNIECKTQMELLPKAPDGLVIEVLKAIYTKIRSIFRS